MKDFYIGEIGYSISPDATAHYKPIAYRDALDEPVKPNSLLIIAGEQGTPSDSIANLLRPLKLRGLDVCVAGGTSGRRGVETVKVGSRKYYKRLATAGVVYTESPLYSEFVKRPEQVVVSNYTARRETLEDRIAYDMSDLKVDWRMADRTEGDGITLGDFAKLARRHRLGRPQKSASGKKTLLVCITLMAFQKERLSLLRNLMSWVDPAEWDVYLADDLKNLRDNRDTVMALGDHVHLVARLHNPLCNEDERRRYNFIEHNFTSYDKRGCEKGFLPDGVMKREVGRLFGDLRPDLTLNIGWNNFAKAKAVASMPGRKVCVAFENLKASNPPRVCHFLSIWRDCDEVYFVSPESLVVTRAVAEETPEEPTPIFMHMPHVPVKDKSLVTTGLHVCSLQISRERYAGLADRIDDIDSHDVVVLPPFEAESAAYAVFTADTPQEDAIRSLVAIAGRYAPVFVFDFAGALANPAELGSMPGTYCYLTSRDEYYALLPAIGNCCMLEGQGGGIAYEAALYGHRVVTYTGKGDVTETHALTEDFGPDQLLER